MSVCALKYDSFTIDMHHAVNYFKDTEANFLCHNFLLNFILSRLLRVLERRLTASD